MKENYFRSKKGFLTLSVITMACWGALYPLVKISYRLFEIDTSDIPSVILYAGVRFLISGIILVALTSAFSKKVSVPRGRTLLYVLFIGLFATVFHYILTYSSITLIDASKAAILKQIGSLFVICFASFFSRGERFTSGKLAGGLIGFASIILININGITLSFSLGDALVVGASFCIVIAGFVSKKSYKKDDPFYVTAWSQLAGGIILCVTGIILGGSIPRLSFMGTAVFALICTASMVGYLLWNKLLKYHEFSSLSVIKFLESVFAALFSALILGENVFKWTYLASFVLVCAGIMLSEKSVSFRPAKKLF